MCLRSLYTLKNNVVLVRCEVDVLPPGDQMAPARTPAADISPFLSSGSFVRAPTVFPRGLCQLRLSPISLTLTPQESPAEILSSPWLDSGGFWPPKGNWVLQPLDLQVLRPPVALLSHLSQKCCWGVQVHGVASAEQMGLPGSAFSFQYCEPDSEHRHRSPLLPAAVTLLASGLPLCVQAEPLHLVLESPISYAVSFLGPWSGLSRTLVFLPGSRSDYG